MTSDSAGASAEAIEQPLSGAAKLALITSAALTILLFYLFAAGCITLLLFLLACELVGVIAAARFGMSRIVLPFIERHSALLALFVRSFWLRKGVEFRVPVTELDAPALFGFLRQLSGRMQVAAPKRVVIEMSAGAWVRLGGFRRGADATTLGLGYDLLAGLSEKEVEAVLAHEMAHAKLVRRGLKRWLAGGVNRAAKLTNELAACVDNYRRALQTFELGEWLLGGANYCTRLGVRLVATYSRQDEFEADRGAAETCGAAPLRSSLIKLERMAAKTARIAWNERVARLQRGDGFTSWLVEELAVTDSPAEVADAAGPSDRFSTHPSLRDRLAALPPDAAALQPSRPAIHLFADPDAIAVKLVAEIHRVVALEEQRDTRERRRWLRRTRRGSHFRALQLPGILTFLLGAFVVIFAWADGFHLSVLALALAIMAGGYGLALLGRYRDRRSLPIPDYATLKAGWELPDDPKAREAREKVLEAELRTAIIAETNRKRKIALLVTVGYQALEKCDYLKGHVASRLCLELKQDCVEAQLVLAIAWASFRQSGHAANMLGLVHRTTGFRSFSTVWGAGWALVLLGDWAGAEAMIEEARRKKTGEPTFAALLALCQAQRNKTQTGIVNARRALAAAPKDKDRIHLLLNLLLNGGYLREAQDLMAGADTAVRSDAELTVSMVRLFLVLRDIERAENWTAELRQHGVAPHNAIQLGAAYEAARRDEQAASFYEQALQCSFFPEAHLGLARLAVHRRDKDTATQHLLAALNATRPVGEKGQSALDIFVAVIGLHVQLQEPITDAEAWIGRVTGNAIAGPLASHSFLVFAADLKDAEKRFKVIADAVQPEKASLLPAYVDWTFAPKDQQPVGHVRPGIQRLWRT